MPTNLLHHGPENRAEKSVQNMAAIEGLRWRDLDSMRRVGGHKSELVWDLYIVQQPSRFHCKNAANKKTTPKATEQTKPNQTKTSTKNAKGKVIGGPVQ